MTAPLRIDSKNGHIIFAVTSEQTAGALGVYRMQLNPRTSGPRPHVHHEMTETFYMPKGSLSVRHGTGTVVLQQGQTVTALPREVHGFDNPHDELAEFLIIFAPNRTREAYFSGLADLATRSPAPSEQEMLEFMASHDQFPPPAAVGGEPAPG